MFQLFNKDFFKFSFGFFAMIVFGLLGIVMTGYLDPDKDPAANQTTTEKVQELIFGQ